MCYLKKRSVEKTAKVLGKSLREKINRYQPMDIELVNS